MSVFLSHLGCEVTSIDNDPKVLELAEDLCKTLNGKVVFKRADAFKLEFPKQYFDVAFHQWLFEHFSDGGIKNLLDEQLKVAKVVVFSVPNNFYPRRDFGDERLLTKEEWEDMLRYYKIKESFNYYSSYPPVDIFTKVFKKILGLSLRKEVMYLCKVTGKRS